MAKNNNLTDFLTDLADSIREKTETTGAINPQDFSDKISGIPKLNGQEKSVTIDEAGTSVVVPDTGYNGMTKIDITVPEKLAVDLSLRDIYGNKISRSTANCYVISKAGYYKFPLVYGNAIRNGQPNPSSYTNNGATYSMDFVNHLDAIITDPYIYNNSGCVPVSAEIVMADIDGVIEDLECNGTEILFKVNSVPSNGGNVVVSVLDGSGVVLWSWHLWLWSNSLDTVTITNSTGYEYDIMPVNLGTVTDSSGNYMNWYWQWGRPNPMPRSSTYNGNTDCTLYGEKTFTKITKATTYGEGIKNPQNFYYNSSSPGNWFGSPSYYNLWDSGCTSTGNSDDTVVKTIYDPCPIGFTIPNGNTFTGFSTSNVIGSFSNGYYFKKYIEDTTGVFFPASGNRSGAFGSLSSVGSFGYVCLSSSYSQNETYSLYFNSSRVASQSVGSRGASYSVRPVVDPGAYLDEITFYLNSTSSKAKYGMTWAQWVESDYNTGEWYVSGSNLRSDDSTGGYYLLSESPTSIIIPNKTYTTTYYSASGCCFVKGTKVLVNLEGEEKNIEDLKSGDLVVSFNVESGENYITEIINPIVNVNSTRMAKLTFSNRTTLEMTDYHPIYTKDGVFKSLTDSRYEKLELMDSCKVFEGYSELTNIEMYTLDEPIVTYTLAVRDVNEQIDDDTADNYYANGVVVHNAGPEAGMGGCS